MDDAHAGGIFVRVGMLRLLAADAVSDGYFTEEPGLLYRKRDGQSTSQPTVIGGYRHELRPVIQTGATAMDDLFSSEKTRTGDA